MPTTLREVAQGPPPHPLPGGPESLRGHHRTPTRGHRRPASPNHCDPRHPSNRPGPNGFSSHRQRPPPPPPYIPTWDTGPWPASSENVPVTRCGGGTRGRDGRRRSTPTPSKPSPRTTPPETGENRTGSPSPSGSRRTSSRGSEATFRLVLARPAGARGIGASGPTSPGAAPRSTGLTNSTPPARGHRRQSQQLLGIPRPPSAGRLGGARRRAARRTFGTLRTLFRRSPRPQQPARQNAGEVGSPVVGLRSNRRV